PRLGSAPWVRGHQAVAETPFAQARWPRGFRARCPAQRAAAARRMSSGLSAPAAATPAMADAYARDPPLVHDEGRERSTLPRVQSTRRPLRAATAAATASRSADRCP